MSNKRLRERSESCEVKISNDEEVIQIDECGHIMCNPGQIIGDFEIKSILGEGTFGRVLHSKNVLTGQHAALKIIKNEKTKRQAAMAEIIALTILSCRDQNDNSLCIKMLKWFNYGGHICIAFPVLGLTVFDFLKENEFEPFPVDHVRHISHQLCYAVNFLHKNGLIHTDLKPENVLFVDSSYTTIFDAKENLKVRRIKCTDIRLIDFGNVTRNEDVHHDLISTRYYRAPEVILKLDWTQTCDVWSIGCVMFEIYVGNLLFPTHDDREHLAMMEKSLGEIPQRMANASNAKLFSNGKLDWDWTKADVDAQECCKPLKEFQLSECEDDAKLFELISKMLEYESTKRLSLGEALRQPFFNKLPSHHQINKKDLIS